MHCCSAGFILLVVLCRLTDALNLTAEAFLKIGPLTLDAYSDVGSQEVVYVEIPAAYLSRFAFEWYAGITTDDGSSAESCPHVFARVLIRKWGIPIPNPKGSSYPQNTWMIDNDTIANGFAISEPIPDGQKYIMLFTDDGNTTGEYYVSLFLTHEIVSGDSASDRTIPGRCKYVVQLSVITFADVPYDGAAIESTSQLQALNPSNYVSDYSLQRYRNGLLSTDYVTAKEGYNISMNSSKFSWLVDPYSDVGGTLRIQLGFRDFKTLSGTVVLRACATWNSNEYITFGLDCQYGYKLVVNSSEAYSEIWYWPFPKSGLWTLDIGLECINGPCDSTVPIDLDINIIQCIESCHSSNAQGDCKIYRTDILFFSACDCKGGWQGIACTDGTNAVPRSKQLLMTLLLTLSNLIFLPCGILAIVKGYYSESVVYFFVMFFSTFYHACDNDFVIALCIIPYNTLQFSDFYGSITAMWVTLIAIAKLPFRLESFFHVIGILAIGMAVTYNRFSVLTTLIPVLSGLFVLAVKWGKQCHSTHECYPKKHDWVFSIIPGTVCAIVGFVLFAFVETPDNYFYVHSMWHILMGAAVLFLLPKEKKFSYDDTDRISILESVSGTYVNDTTAVHLELSDQSDDSS